MDVSFPPEFFVNNRRKLRKLFKDNIPIIITAAGMIQSGADAAYPFHQDANFWYLTGLNDPDMILVIGEREEYLILPERSSYQDIFEGSVDQKALTKISGISKIISYDSGWLQLGAELQKNEYVAVIKPPTQYLKVYGMYTNPARKNLVNRILKINKKLIVKDINKTLSLARMVKQDIEIEMIQRAIDLTGQAIGIVRKELSKAKTEASLEALISSHFISNYASNAWKPIIASGNNATIMHYNSNSSSLNSTDLVLIDIGANVSHYAADITRTILVGKKPSNRQRAVYQAVIEAQDYGIKLQKPGAIMAENEKLIRIFIGKKLKELKLISQINDSEIKRFYPHSMSHFLGLEPHDAGDYKLPLVPGNVLTVEPGIYIPEEGIGVRIEDDVLITAKGNKILSSEISRDLV